MLKALVGNGHFLKCGKNNGSQGVLATDALALVPLRKYEYVLPSRKNEGDTSFRPRLRTPTVPAC